MPGMPRQAEDMQTRRSPALVASIGALLLVATGCGLADDRPASDYGTIADALRALPAVTSVDGPHPSTDNVHDEDADKDDDEDATAFTVALNEDADAQSLRTTGSEAFVLVNDHRYPDGAPLITMTSGPYAGEIPVGRGADCDCIPDPENTDLGVLPLLLTLPDVRAGDLGEISGATQIELEDDTDVRLWAEESAETAASGTDHDNGFVRVKTVDSGGGDPQYRLDLGGRGTAEAVRTLHDAADDAGATVTRAEISVGDSDGAHGTDGSNDQEAQEVQDDPEHEHRRPDTDRNPVLTEGELTVAADADVIPAQRTLLEHFDEDVLGTFTVEAASGLSIDGPVDSDHLDAAADALDALAGADVTTASADAVDNTLTARADDADELRTAAQLVSSPDWPLEPGAEVTVQHTHGAGTGSVFRAADWPDHVGLVASLWEAGFTSVDVEEISHAADLRIRLGRSTGPDPRSDDGRTALVHALRTAGWDGTAEIIFVDDDHLAFTSTADGTAQEAANRLAGADRTPRGWEREFLDAWDASATTG